MSKTHTILPIAAPLTIAFVTENSVDFLNYGKYLEKLAPTGKSKSFSLSFQNFCRSLDWFVSANVKSRDNANVYKEII